MRYGPFNQPTAYKMKVIKYKILEHWLDIGRYDDYEKAEHAYKANFSKAG